MGEEKVHVDFVKNILTALCSKPEDIEIEDRIDERGVLIQVYVAQEDLGRIIGKGGDGANAIRLLLRTLGAKNNAHYGFKVDTRHSS